MAEEALLGDLQQGDPDPHQEEEGLPEEVCRLEEVLPGEAVHREDLLQEGPEVDQDPRTWMGIVCMWLIWIVMQQNVTSSRCLVDMELCWKFGWHAVYPALRLLSSDIKRMLMRHVEQPMELIYVEEGLELQWQGLEPGEEAGEDLIQA